MIPRLARKHRIEAIETAEPTDSTDANEPIEPTERHEPIEPTERTEFREPIDSSEFCDHRDHFDVLTSRIVRPAIGARLGQHAVDLVEIALSILGGVATYYG